MIKHTLNNWPESEREHRLMRETFGPEKLPQNVEETKPVESKEETKPKGSPEIDRKLDKLEVRGRTNAEAEDLKTKLNVADPSSPDAPKVATPEPTKKEVLTFTEKMSKAAGDIRKDFMEGSNWTKAGYIAGGVVGFLAARWLWRKTRELFTKSRKEGLIQKTLKWTVGIGAGIAGVVGAKRLRDYWTNPRNILPGAVTEAAKDATDVAKKGAEGAGKGVDSVRTNFDKAFGTKLPQRSEFKSDAEYQKALKDAAIDHMKNGGKLAMLGNTLYFMGLNGVDAVCKLDDVAVAAFNAVIQQNVETTGEFLEVYLEGAVLYVASFGAIDAAFFSLVLGPKAGVVRALKNTTAWPYSITRKGLRTVGMLTNSAGRSAAMIETKAAWAGIGYNYNRMRLREWDPRMEWTEEHIEDLMKEWKKWNTFEHELSHYHEAKAAIGYRKDTLAKRLRQGLHDLYKKKGVVPKFLQKPEFNVMIEQIKQGQLDLKLLDEEAIKIMFDESDAADAVNAKPQKKKVSLPDDAELEPEENIRPTETEASKKSTPRNVPSEADEGGPARKLDPLPEETTEATPKPKVYDPDGKIEADTRRAEGLEKFMEAQDAEDAARGAKVRAALDGINKMENTEGVRRLMVSDDMQKILKAGNMDEAAVSKFLLETLGDDAKTLEAISLSKRGRWMLKGAMLSGKLDEVRRVIKAGQNATVLAKTLNVAGFAGDAFGAYMAYCDYQEYGQKALDTQNIALQETYRSAQTFKMAEGAINAAGAVGFVVNGVCIMKAGGSLSAALGAPIGAVLVPVAMAAAIAASAHKGLVESVEYHALDQSEMLKKFSPGQMLEHVGKTDNFFRQNINWSQGLFVNNKELLAGNEGARSEAYRAYFAKIGAETLPAPSILECGDDALIAAKEGEKVTLRKIIEAKHKELAASFVNDAVSYIKEKTQGTYTLVDATILTDAMLYSREQWNRRNAGTQTLDVKNNPDQAYSALREARWQQVLDTAKNVNQLSKMKEKDEVEVSATLLEMVRNEMASAEQKILTTDFDHWGRGKAWTNWKGDESIRNAVRGYIAEELWNALRNETYTKTTFTPQEMFAVKENLVNAISAKQPYSLADTVLGSPHYKYYEQVGSNPQRLSVAGMADMVKQYAFNSR